MGAFGLTPQDFEILWFTVRVALLAVALLAGPGLALGWVLARKDFHGKALVETLVALPLVMPPVATGLLLLKLLGRRGPLGRAWVALFGTDLAFTWRAVVAAMMVMSLPLLVRSARVAFEEVSPRLEAIARTLGAGEARVLRTVTFPLATRGIVGGLLLAFARALGEFGATILVAGNIPGRTTTLATGIYGYVQLGQDDNAFRLLTASVVIAFGAVLTAEAWLRRRRT
ncbi:MAG: molybdate ABC transporter permease subunit [Thermoanaerobaculia bacterium]|jgi:molybdate transport system permease protein